MRQAFVTRKVVVVAIAVGVGLLHFVTGVHYRGPFPVFVNSYLIDILLPGAMYLLLGVTQQPLLRSRLVRGAAVFAVGAITETLQYFGVAILGSTFDGVDYLMYAGGILMAVVFESYVLSGIPIGVVAMEEDAS